MAILISGIIHVTGEPDVGKTTFALENGSDPAKTCFIDNDEKGRNTIQEFVADGNKFGHYVDLVHATAGMHEIDYHTYCIGLIDEIIQGGYETIIWDNWPQFAKTCHPYVVANMRKFKQTWSTKGDIKGAQQWIESFKYEGVILNKMSRAVRSVIVSSHLKPLRLGGKKVPGKYVSETSKTVTLVSRFRIWLKHNPESVVPIGLVLKRTDRKIKTERGMRTISILPRRIVPRPEDQSLWDTILWYYENPVGIRPLLPHEIPTAFEITIMEGTLTEDQRKVFRDMLRAGILDENGEIEEAVPTTWQDLLTRSGRSLDDLGGVAVANGMSIAEIEKKWGEWNE